ncbi:MAG: FtsX-like permease family protein [Chitinivibrionales bacterium]|nr:FtsX-like permease family protein [Chitinivibrionales bacterium]MBD3358586.1 FtsX-like permease family protein [Chitinivibrionales bacterium]
MGILVKIAWRNIWRHKGKSLIVGTILFLGALLMTVGAGVITGMNKGLQESIVRSFSGDVVLVSKKQQGDNVFLSMMGSSVEPLPEYEHVKKVLEESDVVSSFLPIGKNVAMVLNDAGGSMDGAFLIGADIKQYGEFFPDNLELVQGSFLKPGEEGVLLATGAQKMLTTSMGIFFMPESTEVDTSIMPEEAQKMGRNLTIRRNMIFMGLSDDNTSTDIRLPVRGLVKYKSLNTILGTFVIMDIESYRHCMGYVAAAHQLVEIPNESKELLDFDESNLDALFAEEDLLVEHDREVDEVVFKDRPVDEAEAVDLDAGTYNLVLVKLRDGVKQEEGVKALGAALDNAGTGVRPVIWHKSIGPVGGMAVLIKSSLFVFVMLLFVVAIVIIVNTLSMSALERTPEIGMMRAIGAQKEFIGKMFFAETVVLAAFFGSIGIAAGWIFVTVLSAMNLTTNNDMVQLLYGGDTFQPFLTAGDFALAFAQLALVAVIAVIYPIIVARNITPLDAISRQ